MLITDKIEEFQTRLADSDGKTRENSLQKLKEVGLPHRRVESWRYTNITPKLDNEFRKLDAPLFEKEIGFSCEIVKISNGKILGSYDFLEVKPLSLLDFSKEIDEKDALFLYNLSTSLYTYEVRFKETPNKPVIFYNLSDPSSEGVSLSTELKVIIGKNIKVDLFEIYEADADNFVSVVKNIELEEGSSLHYTTLTQSKKSNTLHLFTNVDQKKNSYFRDTKIIMDNDLTRNELRINLLEVGAETESYGLYALNNKEHSDSYTVIRHASPHTYSNQLYKGIMAGSSRGVFQGLVKVEKDAQEIRSDQLNRNLLLSKKAEANSKPQLEIFADDVKCNHGSSTGQISNEETFYFISRGIKPDRAKKILSRAYAFDVFLKIENPLIRHFIENYFTHNYEGLMENSDV